MFGSLKNRISSFFKSESNNKRLSAYALFLFISLSFWFLSMLSKDNHETTLKVPVVYVNFPPDKVLVSPPLSFIEARVKASGFSILFYNLFNSSKLNLDIEKAPSKFKKGKSEVFWLMNSKLNKDAVEDVLLSSMRLQAIQPDQLTMFFSNKAKKRVPVRLNRSISLKPEIWFAHPIVLVPDSVMIYGDQQQLDTVDFVETEELLLVDVSESITHNVQLSIPVAVQCKTSVVEAIIEVEPFVEQLLKYKVEVKNLEKGYLLKLFPEVVQVILQAPKDKYSMLQTDFLKLQVDAALISEEDRTLAVEIDNLPSFIQLKRVFPSRVEFLLIKE